MCIPSHRRACKTFPLRKGEKQNTFLYCGLELLLGNSIHNSIIPEFTRNCHPRMFLSGISCLMFHFQNSFKIRMYVLFQFFFAFLCSSLRLKLFIFSKFIITFRTNKKYFYKNIKIFYKNIKSFCKNIKSFCKNI